MKKITPDSPYPSKYDLTNCDNEPIHIIPIVQSSAAIIDLGTGFCLFRQLSLKVSQFISKIVPKFLSKHLSDFFSTNVTELLQKGIDTADSYISKSLRYQEMKEFFVLLFQYLITFNKNINND